MEHPESAPKSVDRGSIPGSVRANAGAWRSLLQRGEIIHQRPPSHAGAPGGQGPWSVLEQAAIVRDLLSVTADRLTPMIKGKSPTFGTWDGDEAAAGGEYESAEPDKVAYALAVNAGKVADLLDRVRDKQWPNTASRSDGVDYTVESLAVELMDELNGRLLAANKGIEAILEKRKAEARARSEADGAGADGGER